MNKYKAWAEAIAGGYDQSALIDEVYREMKEKAYKQEMKNNE